jgi:hypothetical protein
MFCKFCMCQIPSGTEVCPSCGKTLTPSDFLLNPKPSIPIPSESQSSTTPVFTSVEAKEEPSASEAENVSVDPTAEESTIQVSHAEEAVSKQEGPKKVELKMGIREHKPSIQTAQPAQQPVDSLRKPEPPVKKSKSFVPFIVIVVIAIIVTFAIIKLVSPKKSPMPDNTTTATIATTENLGTVSDASMSDSLPVMETDNMVTAKQLTIGEEEYTGKDVKHYSSNDNKTTKLEVYFELDAETAQLYCDEMESNIQNGSVDAEASYVSDDVFCYHLVANKVYQYGKWSDAKLQLLELSDNVSKDTADSAALEYFGKEEYK